MRRLAIATLLLALLAGPAVIADPQNPKQEDQVRHNRPLIANPVYRDRDTKTIVRTERYMGPRGYVVGHRPLNWNHRPRVINRRFYHHNFVAVHRFHWRPYVRPHGWYYRRWVFGERLPGIFWARDYWITSYWLFGLPIPPYGCEWVRYGDDALLIDVETGEILQVIYGIFY
jgi:Ni/Co efflux regulator RcnB